MAKWGQACSQCSQAKAKQVRPDLSARAPDYSPNQPLSPVADAFDRPKYRGINAIVGWRTAVGCIESSVTHFNIGPDELTTHHSSRVRQIR